MIHLRLFHGRAETSKSWSFLGRILGAHPLAGEWFLLFYISWLIDLLTRVDSCLLHLGKNSRLKHEGLRASPAAAEISAALSSGRRGRRGTSSQVAGDDDRRQAKVQRGLDHFEGVVASIGPEDDVVGFANSERTGGRSGILEPLTGGLVQAMCNMYKARISLTELIRCSENTSPQEELFCIFHLPHFTPNARPMGPASLHITHPWPAISAVLWQSQTDRTGRVWDPGRAGSGCQRRDPRHRRPGRGCQTSEPRGHQNQSGAGRQGGSFRKGLEEGES